MIPYDTAMTVDREPKSDTEDGEPTELTIRDLPLSIEKAVRLYQGLGDLKDTVDEEKLAPLLALAEELYRHAHAAIQFAEQANWGELLKDDIKNPLVLAAFSEIKRFDFLWGAFCFDNQLNRPLPIPGEQTISQPELVATMLDALDLEPGQKVLDGGSGSGFLTALAAHIVGPKGLVVGVERDPQLVRFGQDNLAKYPALTSTAEIRLATHQLGLPQSAPFDRIIFSGQIKEEWLPLLTAQLSREGGILITPVASATSHDRSRRLNEPIDYDQLVVKITRNGDDYKKEVISEEVAFVPIIFSPINGQATALAKGAISGSIKTPAD